MRSLKRKKEENTEEKELERKKHLVVVTTVGRPQPYIHFIILTLVVFEIT